MSRQELVRALALLEAGDWQGAHEIVQRDEDSALLLHGAGKREYPASRLRPPVFACTDPHAWNPKKRQIMAAWKIEGQYMETCNCNYVCPCVLSNLTARPTEGDCKFAIAMRIDKGEKDGVKLDGLSFIVLVHSPGVMAEGNMTVGLIVDERASEKQVEAISAIATGSAGGPMAALGPLVGKIAGVEKRPIRFEANGMKFSVKAGDLVDQACEGVAGAVRTSEPLYLDNTAHPVNTRLGLAKATRSMFNAFGIKWKDTSGTRNGHFAPFAWKG